MMNETKSREFPFYRFAGSDRQIGRQFGEACRDLILKHRDYALERLQKNVKVPSMEKLEEAALQYRPYVLQYAPFFDEQIQGISEGAGIPLGQAYFLQLRAEIYREFDSTDECTTYAVLAEATQNGVPLIGQNADLPAFYGEIGIVAEFVPDGRPATLMVTPAGQVSYIGINELGLGVFANFLVCDGWRTAFPRYMLSGLALTKATVHEAIPLIQSIQRASSRNLIMLDKTGGAADLETVPLRTAMMEPTNGLLAHSNHFVGDSLLDEERKVGEDLENSRVRLRRMRTLLEAHHGRLDVSAMQKILRDRETAPHTLCRMPGDFGDSITFASVIAEPSLGNMWVAVGPPHQNEYKCYRFSR